MNPNQRLEVGLKVNFSAYYYILTKFFIFVKIFFETSFYRDPLVPLFDIVLSVISH